MRKIHQQPVLSLSMMIMVTGCTVGPTYTAPPRIDLGVPDDFTRGGGEPLLDADLASWWMRFNDAQLNALIARGLSANLDLAQAAARLRQARESLVQARGSTLPSVSASGGAGRTANSAAPDSNSVSLGADASWEVDLFGKLRRTVEAANADLDRSGYDLATVRVAMIAEIARNYIQLRLSQEQLQIARDTLRYNEDNYNIARWRVMAGLVSSLDEEQARGQLAQSRASIPQIETSLSGALNRLAVLTGEAPGQATRPLEQSAAIPAAPQQIASGIPADTLRQRPDVRAAERSLASATARIGIAKAELYPTLRLSGSLNSGGGTIGSLVDTITGGLFGNIAKLLFDGGQGKSRVRAQKAAADGAFAAYKQSVLTALEDIENALIAVDSARTRIVQLGIALDSANNSAILARSLYRAGVTDFQTLLQTEQALLSARNSHAAARADQALAVVQLYSALGGGWQNMDEKPQ